MPTDIWAKLHGASTHFPVALVLCAGAFDSAGWFFSKRPETARDVHAAGFWVLLAGALGSIPAVISGLLMTQGRVLGHGALRWHHCFVWPAFGLMIGLAVWRVLVGKQPSHRTLAVYLLVVWLTIALLLAAGYWGGELMLE